MTELIGSIVLVCALALLVFLTLWARHRINVIGRRGPGSARKLLKNNSNVEK